jgi:hypothetical protein
MVLDFVEKISQLGVARVTAGAQFKMVRTRCPAGAVRSRLARGKRD